MSVYWFELKRLLKNNRKFIAIGSVLFALLLGLLLPLIDRSTTAVDDTEVDVSESAFGEESRPAFFQFYIENEDGSVFTNFATLEEVFNNERNYEEINEEMNLDLKNLKKEIREETEFISFNPVTVSLNGSSNILTALFETGSDVENINIANFYYDKLFQEGFEFLNNNYIYDIREPQLIELLEENPEESSLPTKAQFSLRKVATSSLTGLIAGFLLSILFLIGREFFSKRLTYLFSYVKVEETDFVLYDSALNNNGVVGHFIGTPFGKEKLVLSEKPLRDFERELLVSNYTDDLSFGNGAKTILENEVSLTELNVDHRFNEIILIVFSNETSRKWYNEQMSLTKLHKVPVKTVQINDRELQEV